MYSDDLRGRVALVPDADTALGRAVALRLGRDGATVALVASSREPEAAAAARAVVAAIDREGGRAAVVPVARQRQRTRRIDALVERFGRVDLVVFAAPLPLERPLARTTDAELERLVGRGVRPTLRLCREAAARLLADGGCVLYVFALEPRPPGEPGEPGDHDPSTERPPI